MATRASKKGSWKGVPRRLFGQVLIRCRVVLKGKRVLGRGAP